MPTQNEPFFDLGQKVREEILGVLKELKLTTPPPRPEPKIVSKEELKEAPQPQPQNGPPGIKKNKNGALYLNIRGLYVHKSRNKVKHLSDLATESNAPWIALTETWLKPEILSAEVQIPGMQLYRADREGRMHGGCALFVRNDLTSQLVTTHSNRLCDTLIVKIKSLNQHLVQRKTSLKNS